MSFLLRCWTTNGTNATWLFVTCWLVVLPNPGLNIVPEELPSHRKVVFQPSFFRGYVKLRVYIECVYIYIYYTYNVYINVFIFFVKDKHIQKSGDHQLRPVAYPIIYGVFRWCRISSINSMFMDSSCPWSICTRLFNVHLHFSFITNGKKTLKMSSLEWLPFFHTLAIYEVNSPLCLQRLICFPTCFADMFPRFLGDIWMAKQPGALWVRSSIVWILDG